MHAVSQTSVAQAREFFDKLRVKGRDAEILRDILPEIRERLKFLMEVGLHYLQLGRSVTIRDGLVGAETRFGEDFVVVGKDGALQIPPELLDALPPGTLARATRTAEGISLERLERAASDPPPAHRDHS